MVSESDAAGSEASEGEPADTSASVSTLATAKSDASSLPHARSEEKTAERAKSPKDRSGSGIRIKPDDALASVLVALWHMTEPIGIAHLKKWQV